MPVINVEELIENRVNAIKEYHKKTGFTRAQLDVSGGVDSAVMLGLLAKALGPENITAVYSGIHSSKDSEQRAWDLADFFGVELFILNLTRHFEGLANYLLNQASRKNKYHNKEKRMEITDRLDKDPTIAGSLRSSLRAPVGRFMNRLLGNGIRHGTGNECEDKWLRFYQKGGDGEVDTNPLAMLSKGEVYQLAIGLGVPESILEAVPSPDLQGVGEEHNDEAELKKLTGVDWTYSKVFLEDVPTAGLKRGDYSYVGTIERMSRMLDEISQGTAKIVGCSIEDIGDSITRLRRRIMRKSWPELNDVEISRLVNSQQRTDSQTYHKFNPNIPTLGTREDLLKKNILTNNLPLEVNKF